MAKLEKTPGGKWVLIPEPDYPLVYEIETGTCLQKTGRLPNRD